MGGQSTGGVTTRSWITGGSTSFTVTVNEQVAVLPEPSVALAVTVVVPTGKKDPDAGRTVTVTAEVQLSVAIAVYVTVAPHCPGAFGKVILAGHVMTGGWTSLTMTLKEQES